MMYADLMGNHKNHRIKSLWDNIVTWHNSVVVLKQQLQQLAAVIGSGLIQALKPFVYAMNNALEGLIKFAQNVVNALGKIFGWEMDVNTSGLAIDDDAYDVDPSGLQDVADAAKDAGKATDGAADSAKKLKEQLQGFDKLNVIRTNDSGTGSGGSGGGGGGGNGGSGGGGGGVSGGDVSASLKKTKGMFESEIDNLFDLGRYISDALSEQMEKIKWNDIYEKARGFGTGLANFLNGLITPRLFANVGRTIANSINTAFEFLNSFGTTFDWGNFGESIGFGINAFLRSFNWGTILNAAKVWGMGLADTINEAIRTTSFDKIGETLSLTLLTALQFLYNFGEELDWKQIGQNLANSINGFIKSFPASQFANTVDAWVKGIYDLIVTAVKNINWGDFVGKIKDIIKNLDFKTISIILTTLAIIKGASLTISIASSIIEEVAKLFVKELAKQIYVKMAASKLLSKALGKGMEAAAEASGGGEYAGQVLGGGLLKPFVGIAGVIGGLALTCTGFWKLWKNGWSTSSGVMVAAGTGISLAALAIIGVLTGGIAVAIVGVTALFALIATNHEKIAKGMSQKWNEMKQSCGVFAEGVKNFGKDIGKSFSELGTALKNAATAIGRKAGEIATAVGSKFQQMKNTAVEKVTSLKDSAVKKWGELKDGAAKKIQGLATSVASTWESIKSTAATKIGGKDGLVSKVKTGFGNVYNGVKEKINSIKSSVSGAWESMKTSAANTLGKSGLLKTVKDKINAVKNAITSKFPFSLGHLFSLKLPKVSVSGGKAPYGIGGKGSLPSFHVKWNRKAYDNPLMYTRPTLVPTLNGYGDGNGGEMVYGHQNLMRDISEASGASTMSAIGNRQLANDQRIIQLLTIIAEKEFGIAPREVFNAVRNEANSYTMRTGRGAFDY